MLRLGYFADASYTAPGNSQAQDHLDKQAGQPRGDIRVHPQNQVDCVIPDEGGGQRYHNISDDLEEDEYEEDIEGDGVCADENEDDGDGEDGNCPNHEGLQRSILTREPRERRDTPALKLPECLHIHLNHEGTLVSSCPILEFCNLSYSCIGLICESCRQWIPNLGTFILDHLGNPKHKFRENIKYRPKKTLAEIAAHIISAFNLQPVNSLVCPLENFWIDATTTVVPTLTTAVVIAYQCKTCGSWFKKGSDLTKEGVPKTRSDVGAIRSHIKKCGKGTHSDALEPPRAILWPGRPYGFRNGSAEYKAVWPSPYVLPSSHSIPHLLQPERFVQHRVEVSAHTDHLVTLGWPAVVENVLVTEPLSRIIYLFRPPIHPQSAAFRDLDENAQSLETKLGQIGRWLNCYLKEAAEWLLMQNASVITAFERRSVKFELTSGHIN